MPIEEHSRVYLFHWSHWIYRCLNSSRWTNQFAPSNHRGNFLPSETIQRNIQLCRYFIYMQCTIIYTTAFMKITVKTHYLET